MSVARASKTVLFAGGGTGGHLFPGIALAEEFQRRDKDVTIVFAGTKRGLEARVIPELGYPLAFLEVQGLVGVKGIKRVKSLFNLPKAVVQALILLVRYRPTLVVGLGGYASAPVLIAAMIAGLPWVLQEQNAFPGLVNRVLSPFAAAIFIAFDKARESLKSCRVYNLGNPLRSHLQRNEVSESSTAVGDKSDSENPGFNILIVGGSQGAAVFNRLLPDVIAGLTERYPEVKVVHQTGKKDLESVNKAYDKAGCKAEVTAFIDDIGNSYRTADLVICRAGALTLAELAEVGKASILVPFPYAAHDHQVFNARAFAENGAALIHYESELESAGLSREIEDLLCHPEKLVEMGEQARKLARPEAREQIVQHCLKIVQEH